MDGARKIRSEKLKEEYTRSLEKKRVEWDGESNVENM